MSDGGAIAAHQWLRLDADMREAEEKAWKSLARYKFVQFGYWVGIWVHLNRISGLKRPNPWAKLVIAARREVANRIGAER